MTTSPNQCTAVLAGQGGVVGARVGHRLKVSGARTGGQEDRGPGGQEDRRTGGQGDRGPGGQEDRGTGGQECHVCVMGWLAWLVLVARVVGGVRLQTTTVSGDSTDTQHRLQPLATVLSSSLSPRLLGNPWNIY